MSHTLLRVENLCVADAENRPIVSGVSFTLERGAALAVTGPSGAGKSAAMRAVCGLSPAGFRVKGTVHFDSPEDAGGIIYLVQQAFSTFDPLRRVGRQLEETLRRRKPALSRKEARDRVLDVLKSFGFDDPERAASLFPCEMSGGMLQRAVTACAVLLEPALIVADEPTSALDAPACVRATAIYKDLVERTGAALVVITHDAAFASSLTENFLVIEKGRLAEKATLTDVRRDPASFPLLSGLLAADRSMTERLEAIVENPEPASGGQLLTRRFKS